MSHEGGQMAAGLGKASQAARPLPWMEKYRPKRVSEIVHQEEVVKMLKTIIKDWTMPHLLFYGPPGTGKTSAILALAHEMFGKDAMKDRVLELNASDDRGIAVIREKVKLYSRTNLPKGKINPETGREMPPWKIIILDEADMMTSDAQSCLRRIMEAHSRSTRFVLICNYVHKIIDPIFSRCSRFRFQAISPQAQVQRLKEICTSEEFECVDEEALNAIVKVSQGDLRRGVTLLQSSFNIYGSLTEKTVYEVSGEPPSRVVSDFLNAVKEGVSGATNAVENIISGGWDVAAILRELTKSVVILPISDVQKAKIILDIAQKDFAILQGAKEYLQLMSLSIRVHSILNGNE